MAASLATVGCSDPEDTGSVTADPCAGACPAEECFAGTCIGGNDGVNNGVNNGDPDAGNNGDPDAPDGCAEDTDCDAEQFCDIPDGADTGSCEDGCRTDAECEDGSACVDHVCVEACVDDDDCDDGEYCGPQGGCLIGCRGDDACDSGFSCVETETEDGPRKRCTPTVCAERDDCPEGFACVDTSCAPGCTDDSCDDNEVCDPDTLLCVAPTGCQGDDECDEAEYCNTDNGECETGCRDNDGCDLGFDCVDHDCEPGACEAHTDCADEFFCDDGTCREGCRQDTQCNDDQVCDGGRCRRGCRIDAACDDDEFCAIDDGDDYGDCDRGCRIDGCDEEQFCNRDTRICEDRGCTDDNQCADAFICENEECVEGCRNDGECAPGSVCVDLACVAGCRGDAGCQEAEYCNVPDDEDVGACTDGCRQGGCPLGQVCNLEDRACREAPCEEDVECPLGRVCDDGDCILGCGQNDARCRLGQICDLNSDLCLAGCRGDVNCGDGEICDQDELECIDGCRNDARCDRGEVCLDNACAPGCRTDEQCPGIETCQDNQCGIPNCEVDDHCPADAYCDGDVCAVGCRNDGACGDNEICRINDRTCIVGCRGDNACGNGEICDGDDQLCRAGCRLDAQCPDNAFCQQDTLTCEVGCRVRGCGDVQVCDVELRECTNVPCDEDTDCTLDRFCDVELSTCELGCRNDAGCGDGEICAENECRDGCRSDNDCGDAQYCEPDAAECIPGCRSDADCGDAEICDDNTCRQGCRSDFACGDGEYCDGAPVGQCETGCLPFECPENQVCDLDTRECTDAPDPTCEVHDDCPVGEVCDFEALVCRPGCRSSDDCDEGEICPDVPDLSQVCRPGCSNNDACPSNQYCDFSQEAICVNGCRDDQSCRPEETCLPVLVGERFLNRCVASTCEEDAECADGLYCDTDEGLCAAGCRVGQCDGNDLCDLDVRECVEGPCEIDGECNGDDEICEDGACRVGCRNDADCGPGFLCNDEAFTCFEGCQVDATCADGDYCAIPEREEQGLCAEGCRIGDCPNGELCDPRTRACVESECLQDADCEDVEFCRDEIECLVGCRGDDACDDGQVCTDGARECVAGCRGEMDGDGICEDELAAPLDLPLGGFAEVAGTACLDDTDYLGLELGVGEILQVNGFVPEEGGQISLAVLDGCGRVLDSTQDGLNLALEFEAPADGVYALRVQGAGFDDTNDYELILIRRPAVCDDDVVQGDVAEPNDTFETAFAPELDDEVPLLLESLRICEGDEDWYAVQVSDGGQRIAATLTQDANQTPLTVEILLDDGRIVLATADGDEGVKTAATQALNEAGTYLIRVSPQEDPGDGAGIGYSLRILVTGSACIADPFEINDVPDEASPLPRGQSMAAVCGGDGDVDWYRFLLRPGDFVVLESIYDHDAIGQLSELPATLYGPGGINDLRDFLVRDGNSDTDRLLQSPDGFTVGDGDAGQWMLAIESGGVGTEVPYLVDLMVDSPQCDGDDEDVPNDNCGQAGPLQPGESATGLICGPTGDEDWFQIPVETIGQDVVVELEHFHFQGNLELEVYGPGGEVLVGFSYLAGPNVETVEFEAMEEGPHCARVFSRGAQVQNGYEIRNLR